MAKTSKIARNDHRREVVARYAEVRAELKKASVDSARPRIEGAAVMRALLAFPRDASPTRFHNRDADDGRPRGYLGKFGLSRIRMRAMAHRGELPGVT